MFSTTNPTWVEFSVSSNFKVPRLIASISFTTAINLEARVIEGLHYINKLKQLFWYKQANREYRQAARHDY